MRSKNKKSAVVQFGNISIKVPNPKSGSVSKKSEPWEAAFQFLEDMDECRWEPVGDTTPAYMATLEIIKCAKDVFALLRDKDWKLKQFPQYHISPTSIFSSVSVDLYYPETPNLFMTVDIYGSKIEWEKYGATVDYDWPDDLPHDGSCRDIGEFAKIL